jgi:hypothetical protein
MMISERRMSVRRAIVAQLAMDTKRTATATFFGSELVRCDSFSLEPAATERPVVRRRRWLRRPRRRRWFRDKRPTRDVRI